MQLTFHTEIIHYYYVPFLVKNSFSPYSIRTFFASIQKYK
nr:MAG TPA: hypothetical protein [Caudoviricetes sp.]